MNLEEAFPRCAELLEAGRDHLLARHRRVKHLEVLLADLVFKLRIDDCWRGIRCVAGAAGYPLPHHLWRRFEPKPGEGNAHLACKGRKRLAFLLLSMHGIDDHSLTPSKRHQRSLAADGIDFVGYRRRIGAFRESLGRSDAKQPLSLNVAPDMNGAWKCADIGRNCSANCGFTRPR